MIHQTFRVLETHPVLVLTFEADFNIADDWDETEVQHILDTHPEPLFMVCDIGAMTVSFDDLMAVISRGARGQAAILHHPRIRGLYFVSASPMIKMAAPGLNISAFGNIRAQVFETVEAALADIERLLAAAT